MDNQSESIIKHNDEFLNKMERTHSVIRSLRNEYSRLLSDNAHLREDNARIRESVKKLEQLLEKRAKP